MKLRPARQCAHPDCTGVFQQPLRGGEVQRFCSSSCQSDNWDQQNPEARQANRDRYYLKFKERRRNESNLWKIYECAFRECLKNYVRLAGNQKYCSSACRRRAMDTRSGHRQPSKIIECANPQCNRMFERVRVGHKYCTEKCGAHHWRSQQYDEQRKKMSRV